MLAPALEREAPAVLWEGAVPRQRTHHSRRTHVFPDDFPQRLERFKVESGLSWAEIARRLRTYPLTIRRWRYEGVRPNLAHQMALLDLAESLGLGHLFTGPPQR